MRIGGKGAAIPPDVVFDIRETVTQEDGSVREVSSKIEGHKQLLAAANPVFR